MTEAPNWLTGFVLVAIASVKLFIGLDLLIAGVVAKPIRRLPGSRLFWLGVYTILSAVFLYGTLGIFLLFDAQGTVPLWFFVPMCGAGVSAVIYWLLLGRENGP